MNLAYIFLAATAVQTDDNATVDNTKPDENVDNIVVTASRTGQKLENLSTAVSLVTRAEILEKDLSLLPDLLREEAGVYIQQTTPGQGIPIIRGLKGSENIHLVDGMRLNTAFFRNSPNQYLALVDPFMTERIEVIRGPASVLYGGDALGGVLNILTHTPAFSGKEWQNSGELYFSYDSADDKMLSHITWDSGNETIASTLGLSYQDTGIRTIGGGDKIPFTAYTSKAVNNKWIVNISEDKQFKLNMQFLNQPSTPRVDDLVAGFGQTEPDSSMFLFSPNERQFVQASLSDGTSTGFYDSVLYNVSWQRIKDHRKKTSFGSTSVTREQNESSLFSFQSSFNKSLGNEINIVYGLDYYHDTINSAKQKISDGITTESESRFPDDSTMRHIGFFADSSKQINNHTIKFGLRYSDYKIDLNNQTAVNDILNLDDLTWHSGWLYHLNEENKIFANLGRGFRPPNIFDLGQVGERPGNRFNIINTNIKPETVHTLDFGMRHFSTNWFAEVTLFYSSYKDKISSVETGELTDQGQIIVQSQNINDVKIYGLESSLNYEFENDSELNIVLNYTWGEEMFSDFSEPADRIPPLNGFIGYRKKLTDSWEINPKIIFSGTQDRLSSRDIGDPRINPMGTGGFVTYNFYSTWNLPNHTNIRMGIENIFDKKYREHGSGLEAAGRNLHVSVNHMF